MPEHPDPSGPDQPDEPTAARDGAPNGSGESIEEQAAADEPVQLQEPPMLGDKQLTLAGMGLPRRSASPSALWSAGAGTSLPEGGGPPSPRRRLISA